jgi:hypothetical protein
MSRQARYSRWLMIGGLLTLIFILASCQSGCGSSSNNINKPALPTAPQLISQAQNAIQQVKSYHFNLSTAHSGKTTSNAIQINKVDGDIEVPDKLQAKANAMALGFAITTQIIAIANQQYYTDPITGLWTQTTNLLDPRTITNSHTGFAGILGHIEQLTSPIKSNVSGIPCWSINGTLDAQYLSVITGQTTQPGHRMNTTICIGQSDSLLYSLRMQGIALQSDTMQTVRTILFSRFNESLRISEPQMS